jgi:L-malate glycosyltransferase
MKKKLKIFMIIPWYPDKNDKKNPSRGAFFQEQFRNLSSIVDITVLIINLKYFVDLRGIKDLWQLEKDNNEKAFNIYKLNAFYIPKSIKYTSKYISYLISNSELCTIMKNTDIIHSHVIYPSGAIGYELSKKFKKPFILTEHISIFSKLIQYKYLHDILINTNYVTTVSNYLKNIILKEGRTQCRVIPNYIDTTKYYINLSKKHRIQFIHISSMAPIKNVDLLLKGFKKFIDDNQINAKLLLLGGGSNIIKYKELSETLNIKEYVEFKGDVSNKELRKYLSISDALLLTSALETFSVVGIEALASGIPVISTKCGGPEDYILEDTGIFIEKFTENDVSKSMKEFIQNKEKYSSIKIKKICFENFDQLIVIHKINALYKKIVSRNNE